MQIYHNMKRTLIALLLVAITYVSALAQVGVTIGYTSMDVPKWENVFQEEFGFENQLFVRGSRVGVNYWLRLEKVRLEFFPSIEYANSGTQIGFESSINQVNYEANFFGGFLHTRIYPFDFINDCDCPTFSKQNETFKKGFFIMLSSGMENMKTSITRRIDETEVTNEAAAWQPSFGAGIGFDIGVSDFLTLTPIASAKYTQELSGDHIVTDLVEGYDVSELFQFFIGVNIGLRFSKY